MHKKSDRGTTFPAAPWCAALLLGWGLASAQTPPSGPSPSLEANRQQERERALRAQQEINADVRSAAQPTTAPDRFPAEESPCRPIHRILLQGAEPYGLPDLLNAASGPRGDDDPRGRCLGAKGIDLVLARLQRGLVLGGWVTTRVLAPPQDLSSGTLQLTLVPGRLRTVRLADGSDPAPLATALPLMPGQLLNLRDIEQGLENLQRAPFAQADIAIEPASGSDAGPGDSDLVVTFKQPRRVRANVNLDDSGTNATGRNQGAVTAAADNLLGLGELLYVTLTHSVDRHGLGNPARGTEGQVLHFSLPYGPWLLGLTASANTYHQRVAGYSQDYVYSGKSSNGELRLARVVHRDQQGKTSLAFRMWQRQSRNFVEDAEVEVQRRNTGGWEVGVGHKAFLGPATLEANVAWRRGTGAFASRAAPEEAFGEGTSRMALYTADAALQWPWQWGDAKLRYGSQWRAQWNRSPLVPQDRFAIGGRYTVRGFDGESSLMAERGWVWRNELAWTLSPIGAELYAGIDAGRVGGPSVDQLAGRSLVGAVLGLRGKWAKQLDWEVFVGTPLRKPDGMRTSRATMNFSLNYGL